MSINICLSSRYSIAYSILGFSTVVAAFFQVFLWTLASGRQIKRIRSLFFHHVMQQEISWFDINETGDLSTRLSEWVTQNQHGCVHLNHTCKHGDHR